jgi:hypothetical protein
MVSSIVSNTYTILGHEFDLDELRDIVDHGMSVGVSGFVYYSETTKVFDEYDDEIQDFLSDWCYDNGMGPAFAYFAPDAEDITQLKNKLVWSYVELKAHQILCVADSNY